MKLNWDYTELASTYDDRADYDSSLIAKVYSFHKLGSNPTILDMGAGTGKLTKELVKQECQVIASEPNEAMREIGKKNITNPNCRWIASSGESINVSENSIDSIWFGSSFNVIDHNFLKKELQRILKPASWLTCLWNHRDLEDSVQKSVEEIIKREIPKYNYGSRRQDPTSEINDMELFQEVTNYEGRFEVTFSKTSYIEAWKSHATLQRQCRDQKHFLELIRKIEENLNDYPELVVPYVTRLWTARIK